MNRLDELNGSCGWIRGLIARRFAAFVPRLRQSHANCASRLARLTHTNHATQVSCLALCLLAAPLLRAASEGTYTNIYQRRTVEFDAADFFKPAESRAEDLTITLAPLLMQEVVSGKTQSAVGQNGLVTGSEGKGDQPGALVISNGTVMFDPSQATIYTELATVSIRGKSHIQATYLWFYSAAPAPTKSALTCQGIRLTLDSGGRPVIWEVMADTSGARVMFVSESVEAAARARFGPPLPGRRYAIERSLEDSPDIVVARVIDDGPVPMGPFLYLSAETRCVSTVLCRCMPPQVKSLLSTRTYELVPSKDAPIVSLTTTPHAPSPAAFWRGDGGARQRLEECLRLPDAF